MAVPAKTRLADQYSRFVPFQSVDIDRPSSRPRCSGSNKFRIKIERNKHNEQGVQEWQESK